MPDNRVFIILIVGLNMTWRKMLQLQCFIPQQKQKHEQHAGQNRHDSRGCLCCRNTLCLSGGQSWVLLFHWKYRETSISQRLKRLFQQIIIYFKKQFETNEELTNSDARRDHGLKEHFWFCNCCFQSVLNACCIWKHSLVFKNKFCIHSYWPRPGGQK